jgi:serine/threonine protein kinase
LKAEDTLIEAMQQAAALKTQEPEEAVLTNLIARFSRLPASGEAPAVTDTDPSQAQEASTGEGTRQASQAPPPAESTQEVYDFLAPPQGPGEIGRLGPYRIVKVLGVGGMGVVFQAEDLQLQRLVALKVMRSAMLASAFARRRFLREAQASAGIDHEHIVTILQMGEDRGVPYLAMQLLQGETLEERLKREEKLPPEEVLHIGREIAVGLAAAHEGGLIHRDIKPANIWLETVHDAGGPSGSRDRVKILDFGLARAFGGDVHLTQSGVIVGTPAYMAPEQAQGGAVDPRTDLFSLGCVLYRLCTGRVPFQGATTMATLRALELEQPQPPHRLNPQIPRALSDLILKLLAKRPDDRCTSARTVVETLEAIREGRALVARPSRRPRRRLVLAAAIGLGVLGMVCYLWVARPESSKGVDVSETGSARPSKTQGVPPMLSNFAPQVTYAVGVRPYAVAVADFNGDGKQDLAVSNLSSDSVSVLLGNGDGSFKPAVHYPTGVEPHGVAVGDFNGDGKPDLAVANLKSDTLSVLLGNGDGSFKPAVSYTVGKGPRGVAIGDFNGDGKADLVVTDFMENSVSILLGNGDGTFQAAASYRSIGRPISVAVADVNGDGKADLVASNSAADTVSVLLGNGDGSFRPAVYYQVGSGPGAVVVADFNGDGKPDIAVENFGSDSVSVLLGNGDGTFRTAMVLVRARAVSPWQTSTAMGCSTLRWPTMAAAISACSWATAMAPLNRPSISPSAGHRSARPWVTSTATAKPTWPWPTMIPAMYRSC